MQLFTLFSTLLFSTTLLAGTLPNHKFTTIKGETKSLSDFKGKSVLVVNIATQCGYTKQLEGLEALQKKYSKKGFVVLGIPSNDFGGQTPEKNEDVAKFCKLRYGVTFPLATKTVVRGEKKHPLFKSLIDAGSDKSEVGWNFEKFLIDKKGNFVARFKSNVKPTDEVMTKKIEAVL